MRLVSGAATIAPAWRGGSTRRPGRRRRCRRRARRRSDPPATSATLAPASSSAANAPRDLGPQRQRRPPQIVDQHLRVVEGEAPLPAVVRSSLAMASSACRSRPRPNRSASAYTSAVRRPCSAGTSTAANSPGGGSGSTISPAPPTRANAGSSWEGTSAPSSAARSLMPSTSSSASRSTPRRPRFLHPDRPPPECASRSRSERWASPPRRAQPRQRRAARFSPSTPGHDTRSSPPSPAARRCGRPGSAGRTASGSRASRPPATARDTGRGSASPARAGS